MLKLTPFEETVAGKEYIQEGMQQAMQDDIIAILDERLTNVPTAITDRVKAIRNLELLRKVLRQAATIDSIDDFAQALDSYTTGA